MIDINNAAPIRGDIKQLGYGAGLLTSTPGVGNYAIGSFTLPTLQSDEEVLLIVEAIKSALSGDFQQIGTSTTADELPAASPLFIKNVSTHVWVQSRVMRSLSNNSINYTNQNMAGTVTTGTANIKWGNVSSQQTININMTSSTTVDIEFKWAAYLIGADVK